jgi:hypothetical protein
MQFNRGGGVLSRIRGIEEGAWNGGLLFEVRNGASSNPGYDGATNIAMKIATNGNVGIGTTNPYSSLQVGNYTGTGGYARGSVATFAGAWNSTLPSIVALSTDNTSTINKGGGIGFGSGSEAGSSPYIYAQIKGLKESTGGTYNGYLAFYTTPTGSDANTERMRINGSGNVGIGTTSPSVKLHVIGNVTVSATLLTENIKLTGTLTDSFSQVGTPGQVLSSTGTGVEWVTGGGGGGGSTIVVKDEGTTIGSSFTTLNFIGDNVNATASGSTAVIEVSGRASTGSFYYEDVSTPFVIPGGGFANVEINAQTVMATVPSLLTGSNKLMATITFGVSNVSTSEAFNGFQFRLYNLAPMFDIPRTTNSWNGYMSKDEGCTTTVFTFHIPIDYGVVNGGDTIVVQADTLPNYTPEIYYCALTLMEGTN